MAADSERVLRWRDGRLAQDRPLPSRLLVADSFLVADGEVVAIERHRERFLSSVRSRAISGFAGTALPSGDERFWATAVGALPREGRWFPRLELAETADGPLFQLRVRPAPPVADSVSLATWMGRDPRRVPSIKGPDLEALLEIRARAVAQAAGEAVLLSPEGFVCDGTTSAIAWWEDDALCIPPKEMARVDSVTVRCVLALAESNGTPVRWERRRPEELAGREVWALNGLHGIRGVDAWLGGPAVGGLLRLGEWSEQLDALRRPLDSIA